MEFLKIIVTKIEEKITKRTHIINISMFRRFPRPSWILAVLFGSKFVGYQQVLSLLQSRILNSKEKMMR